MAEPQLLSTGRRVPCCAQRHAKPAAALPNAKEKHARRAWLAEVVSRVEAPTKGDGCVSGTCVCVADVFGVTCD